MCRQALFITAFFTRAHSILDDLMMTSDTLPPVYSMHWNNIADAIRQGQKEVFDHLGIVLIQENADQQAHGTWMEEVISRHQPDDVIVFCDIDAFPLTRAAFSNAVQKARSGAVFGLAQFSNHKKTQEIYAGPMFMAFRKDCWEKLGRPIMKSDKQFDAAEALSVSARKAGVPIVLAYPTSTLIPRWALASKGVFGIGTFYDENDFFHLFESRKPQYEQIFSAVVSDVVNGRGLNFDLYLSIAQKDSEVKIVSKKRNWIPKPLRRFFAHH